MVSTSISRPEQTEEGLVRSQGEKRDVQLTLNAVAPSEDEDSRIRRMARERGFTEISAMIVEVARWFAMVLA